VENPGIFVPRFWKINGESMEIDEFNHGKSMENRWKIDGNCSSERRDFYDFYSSHAQGQGMAGA